MTKKTLLNRRFADVWQLNLMWQYGEASWACYCPGNQLNTGLVISGPVSLTRTGLDFNCKRLQKNWTAVPVHQRFESVAVPVHIF